MGNDILAKTPFSVDLDRGLLTLNDRTRWREAITVPCERDRDRTLFSARINGHHAWLGLDTGAFLTALDDNIGKKFGLAIKKLDKQRNISGLYGSYKIVGRFLATEVKCGPLIKKHVFIIPLPYFNFHALFRRHIVGLLGMNMLRPYRFRIDQRDKCRVELAIRPSLASVKLAAERIQRWPWAKSCKGNPGCLAIELRDAKIGLVEVTSNADYRRSIVITVGVVSPFGRWLRAEPTLHIYLSRIKADERIQAKVRYGKKHLESLKWALHRGGKLKVLDLNPHRGSRRGVALFIRDPADQ